MTTKTTELAVIETAADAKTILLDLTKAKAYLAAYRSNKDQANAGK